MKINYYPFHIFALLCAVLLIISCGESKKRIRYHITQNGVTLFSGYKMVSASLSNEKIDDLHHSVEFTPISGDPYRGEEHTYRAPYSLKLEGDLSMIILKDTKKISEKNWQGITLKPNRDGSTWNVAEKKEKTSLQNLKSFEEPQIEVLIKQNGNILFRGFHELLLSEPDWNQFVHQIEYTPDPGNPLLNENQPYDQGFQLTIDKQATIQIIGFNTILYVKNIDGIKLIPNENGTIWTLIQDKQKEFQSTDTQSESPTPLE